ncbi:MAG: Chromosomal replication initiator protein DnaA [Chlamydiae bacterium]|nr:Chromosomal replication initiator protein DnaA [Chlamydiota bacterium]
MKAWSNLLKLLDLELGAATVDKWLRTLKVVKFDAGNLYLDAESSFQINYFEEYVSPHLPNSFLTGSGRAIKVHITLGGEPLKKERVVPEVEHDNFPSNLLESHAHLDEFVLGEDENLAHKILIELADSTLELGSYNPIYLYGPKGSGKSHLLMATARALEEQGKKALFVTSETFTEHVIRAFRSTQLQEFRKSYRKVDVLLIDDVHLFSRRAATQEELFHTFNHLHTSGKQIILSANDSPRNLEEIEERLISRFEWGITLPVAPPLFMEKALILERRAKALSLPIDPLLKQYLISNFKNLHSLIRALEALALRFSSNAPTIDVEIAEVLLRDLLDEESRDLLTADKLLKIVANTFGIKIEDILGKAQSKEYALPRQIAMYLCRIHLKMSFPKIGRFFLRDHSTVISSVNRIKKGIEKKEEAFLLPLSTIQRVLQ